VKARKDVKGEWGMENGEWRMEDEGKKWRMKGRIGEGRRDGEQE
jgi:hypothetical protein